MTCKDDIKAHQRAWATARGYALDEKGYFNSVGENLFQPLSQRSRNNFETAGGSELKPRGSSRPKLQAVHSSAALAANVFDYWTFHASDPLASTLKLSSPIVDIEMERAYPSGLLGIAPTPDVSITLSNGTVLAIESKFTEWMPDNASEEGKAASTFTESYFPDHTKLWEKTGLHRCQALAESMQQRQVSFRYLDAAQLLRHSLGFSTKHKSAFQLLYIYYDCPGSASDKHADEIETFSQFVGSEVGFSALRYQDLFRDLAATCLPDYANYMYYLTQRYG